MKINFELSVSLGCDEDKAEKVKEYLEELSSRFNEGLYETFSITSVENFKTKETFDNGKTAILLRTSDGHEALYVDGEFIADGHPINEGFSRLNVLAGFSNLYNFDLNSLIEKELEDDDNELVETYGTFPGYLEEYSSTYI